MHGGDENDFVRGYFLASKLLGGSKRAFNFDALSAKKGAVLKKMQLRYEGLNPAGQAMMIRKLAETLRIQMPIDNPLPPRAKTILANEVPIEVGKAWLSACLPRTGFRSRSALRRALRQLLKPSNPRRVEQEKSLVQSLLEQSSHAQNH